MNHSSQSHSHSEDDDDDDLMLSEQRTPDQSKSQVADKESLAVSQARVFVMVMLSSAAGVVFLIAYLSLSSEQEDQFKTYFVELSEEVFQITRNNFMQTYLALESFSIVVMSQALHDNETWPFLSLPFFQQRAVETIASIGAEMLIFAPIVNLDLQVPWELYALENQGMIWGALDMQHEGRSLNHMQRSAPGTIPVKVHPFAVPVDDVLNNTLAPVWHVAPLPLDLHLINHNLHTGKTSRTLAKIVHQTHGPAVGLVGRLDYLSVFEPPDMEIPMSMVTHPIFSSFEPDAELVGYLVALIPWNVYFKDIQANLDEPLIAVTETSCGESFTFKIDGESTSFSGVGDLHNGFDSYVESRALPTHKKLQVDNEDLLGDYCALDLFLYPTKPMRNTIKNEEPIIYSVAILIVFGSTGVLFLLYDFFVERRQVRIVTTALQAGRIVASLFPGNVANLLFADGSAKAAAGNFYATEAPKNRLRAYMTTAGDDDQRDTHVLSSSQPIADLFPETTVMFADIAGFTAWSSVREPSQVFTLLETVYRAFDQLAKQRGVFKVETIGDCYVAVCGLPQPRKDHAVVMAKFAQECLNRMNFITSQLEVTLGPDTGDLMMRIGLHSGPVTAGVLRGERARFQLFGDTVNTTSRIESSGKKDNIHISLETAELLRAAGKENWIEAREDIVAAKGKGELQTFWLFPKKNMVGVNENGATYEQEGSPADETNSAQRMPLQSQTSSRRISGKHASQQHEKSGSSQFFLSDTEKEKRRRQKLDRLIGWNCELLQQHLRQICARRARKGKSRRRKSNLSSTPKLYGNGMVSEEVVEIINLPDFQADCQFNESDARAIDLGDDVQGQLRTYVTLLASTYRDNPFHNFDHASHVAMSVSKLLARIVAPDLSYTKVSEEDRPDLRRLHDHTYGITSDPLTQFAVVLSALIHDADHRGVPNFLLVKEDAKLAAKYMNQSVAEQNSVDVAWAILMDDKFEKLRSCIYSSDSELRRFRQLIVNSVMATDIFDKHLAALRKSRWEKAFQEGPASNALQHDEVNRKATIVIEHLIQASDVAHTMQHWHVYQKWNSCLFEEMYSAYLRERSDKDPAPGWYAGEIWFFDNYIIPLAKKLKECGVFGVSSDEYLNYAEANRREWELKGESIVGNMVEECKAKYGVRTDDYL